MEQALQNGCFLFNWPLPPKMAKQFMLHDKENKDIQFCFKASVCELLGDEYLISWLLSARMHISGTAMHITNSPLSHTSLTYCPLHLPARPQPTHSVDGRNVMLKKLSLKNHTQAPGGLAPPKTCQTTAKTLEDWAAKSNSKESAFVSTGVLP